MVKNVYSIGLHVKYQYSCEIWMELVFFQYIFKKYWNIKFSENPSSGSLVVPCRCMDRWVDRQTWRTEK